MAVYKVTIAPSAAKELDGPPKRARERLALRIRCLGDDPRPHGCKKLAGQDKYRLRQGFYRVVYSVDDSSKTVDVVGAGHRKDIYR